MRVPSEPRLHRRLESTLNQDLSGSKDRAPPNTTRTPVPLDSCQEDLRFLENVPRKHQFPPGSPHPRTRVMGGSQEAPCSPAALLAVTSLPGPRRPPPGRPRASSALTPLVLQGAGPPHLTFQSLQKSRSSGLPHAKGGVGKARCSSRGFLSPLQLKTMTTKVASTTHCSRHLHNGVGDSLGGTGGGGCVLTALVRFILVQKESLTRSSPTWGEGSVSRSHFQLINQPFVPHPHSSPAPRAPGPQAEADTFTFLSGLPDARDLHSLVSGLSTRSRGAAALA